MSNCVIFKVIFVIFLIVEPYDSRNIDIFEDFYVFIRVLSISMFGISVFDWSHECCKLTWDNPVQVSILNSLIIFVFFDVERSEIIPSKSDTVFKTLKTMQKGAIIEAVSLGGISKVSEKMMIWLKFFICLISSHF